MDAITRQQSNSKLLLTENLQLLNESITKLTRTGSGTGSRIRGTEQMKYAGITFVFYFDFYFMSPKGTKTKIIIGITPSLQA